MPPFSLVSISVFPSCFYSSIPQSSLFPLHLTPVASSFHRLVFLSFSPPGLNPLVVIFCCPPSFFTLDAAYLIIAVRSPLYAEAVISLASFIFALPTRRIPILLLSPLRLLEFPPLCAVIRESSWLLGLGRVRSTACSCMPTFSSPLPSLS